MLSAASRLSCEHKNFFQQPARNSSQEFRNLSATGCGIGSKSKSLD